MSFTRKIYIWVDLAKKSRAAVLIYRQSKLRSSLDFVFSTSPQNLNLSKNTVLAALLVALVPAPAFAAGSAHGGIESLAIPAFNFGLFLILFAIVYRKAIVPQIKARSIDIREQVKTSSQALRSIEADLSTLRDRLSEIAAEKEEMINNYDSEGDALARLIIARAQESAKMMAKDTARRVEQEFKHATSQVKAEAIELAMKRVRAELKTSLSADKDSELRRSSLRAIAS